MGEVCPEQGREAGFATVGQAREGRFDGAELADNEAAGMLAGITLVWHGLAVVTRGNRFMAPQHAGKAVPDAIIWDDDGRAGRVPSPQG